MKNAALLLGGFLLILGGILLQQPQPNPPTPGPDPPSPGPGPAPPDPAAPIPPAPANHRPIVAQITATLITNPTKAAELAAFYRDFAEALRIDTTITSYEQCASAQITALTISAASFPAFSQPPDVAALLDTTFDQLTGLEQSATFNRATACQAFLSMGWACQEAIDGVADITPASEAAPAFTQGGPGWWPPRPFHVVGMTVL